jgi:hypothetical protein
MFLHCYDVRRVKLKATKKLESVTRQAWLVGVGVYDSGREKAADKFDQLFVEGSAFINELLEKGESVESQLQEKLRARKMLQNKISALRAKLGFGNDSRDKQIDLLTQRVDNLIDVVAKLAQQQMVEKKTVVAPKVAAKKAPVKRTTVAKAAKPVATKATVKPAVTKAATKPTAEETVAASPVKAEGAKTPAKPRVRKVAVVKAESQPQTDDKD